MSFIKEETKLRGALLAFFLLNPFTALASVLSIACDDGYDEGCCMMLLQGFVSGYMMGFENSEHSGSGAPNGEKSKLCIPAGISSKELYDAIKPNLEDIMGYLDISIYTAAISTYPCHSPDSS